MLLLALSAFAKSGKIPEIDAATTFSWYGIDYSAARFAIPETFDEKGRQYTWTATIGPFYSELPLEQRQLDTPADAIEAFARSANDLVLAESLGDLQDATKRKIVAALPDKHGPGTLTGDGHGFGTTASVDPAVLDATKVAAMVATWPAGTGVGLGMIADALSKSEEKGCFWPVVFDAATHQVYWTERVCGELGGMGMRNYYFHPVKDVIESLATARKKSW